MTGSASSRLRTDRSHASGLILTLVSQPSGESAHQIIMLVVRFTQRMGTIRCDRTTRSEEPNRPMDAIRDQRAIVDRRTLAARPAAIAGDRRADERAAVLAELKSALAAGRAEVRCR